MFGAFTIKTITSLFASILSLVFVSSTSLSVSPSPTPVDQQQLALKEFHDLQLQLETLKIENLFPRVLKRGIKGDDVKELQDDLSGLYPSLSDGGTTNYFGVSTEKILKQFQTDRGLPTTGIFDIKTRDTLASWIASSSLDSTDSSFPELNNFLTTTSTTPNSTSSLEPSSEPTPTNTLTLDDIDTVCINLGFILPNSCPDNSSNDVPEPTELPTPSISVTPKPATTVTPTPTTTKSSPTPIPTATPKLSPTATPKVTVTPTPIPTATAKPTVTPTPTPKATITPTPTAIVTPTPTAIATPKPTVIPSPTLTPVPTATPK